MGHATYVCFVALREEMKYINELLINQKATPTRDEFWENDDVHQYWVTEPTTRAKIEFVFVVVAEMGNLATANVVTSYLSNGLYQAAFIIGIAGTLYPEKFRLGDVVVSASAKYIGFDKVKESSDRSVLGVDGRKWLGLTNWIRVRRDVVSLNRSELQVARYVESRKTQLPAGLSPIPRDLISQVDKPTERLPAIHNGIILGSDWVVDSTEWAEFLRERNKDFELDWYKRFGIPAEVPGRTKWRPGEISCLDMESFGFFKAADMLQKIAKIQFHAIAIRGISDPCEAKSDLEETSGGVVRSVAAKNSALILLDFAFHLVTSDAGS